MAGVLLNHPPSEFFRQGFSLNTELTNWIGRPASVLLGSPVSTFPALVLYAHNIPDLNLHGCWRAEDPNLGRLLTQQTSDQLTCFASFSSSLLKARSLAREAVNPFNYPAQIFQSWK